MNRLKKLINVLTLLTFSSLYLAASPDLEETKKPTAAEKKLSLKSRVIKYGKEHKLQVGGTVAALVTLSTLLLAKNATVQSKQNLTKSSPKLTQTQLELKTLYTDNQKWIDTSPQNELAWAIHLFVRLKGDSALDEDKKNNLVTIARSEVNELLEQKNIRAGGPSFFDKNVSMLFFAVLSDDLETSKLLLEKGASPNIPDLGQRGQYPLHIAVINKNLEMVQLLLKYFASTEVKTPDEKTPLDLARSDDIKRALTASPVSFNFQRLKQATSE